MEYDTSYRAIFSHPEIVKELLQEFVQEPWVNDIDYSTLEKQNGSYVTEDLRDRADDIVWRVKVKQRWLYLYLLIEFQSRNDPWMAVRLMVYIGLLYQDLIKTQTIKTGERLPPVFPIVVYNGESPWRAEQTLSRLIEPYGSGIETYRPELRYALLDEGHVPEETLTHLNSPLSDIIRLENSPEPQALRVIIARLRETLKDKRHDSLRRALTVWLNRIVIRQLVPEEDIPELRDLQEIDNMLAERVEQWTRKWESAGIQKGVQKGRQEGRQEGKGQLLLRQIQKRFGEIPDWVETRIDHATEDRLEQWAENILDAATMEEVFQD